MNQKYTLALPLYRQEQEFKRFGIELSRQNLSNWIIKGAELLKPLYNELISNLMEEELLHADETVLEVLSEPERPVSAKSYVWVYRTSVYNKHPIVVYEYTRGRNGVYAQTFLKIGRENIFIVMDIRVIKNLRESLYVDVLSMQRENFMKPLR